jgi:hypothetical protein
MSSSSSSGVSSDRKSSDLGSSSGSTWGDKGSSRH